MTLEKNGYAIIRRIIPKKHAIVMGKDIIIRRDGYEDVQVSGALSFNSQEFMKHIEKERHNILRILEKKIGLKLYKTYAYARIYKNGNILGMHRDREACEISVTIDLGGDPWDVWLLNEKGEPIKVILNPGDAVLYYGCKTWHWRSIFKGKTHIQLFMHYVDKHGKFAWCKDDIIRTPPT